jgi:UDP-2-acetamido-2,6-beta-L-arabino-hexul-4-ose reductase
MKNEVVGLTGARGFIGRHLEPALKVRGYDVQYFDGDICNPEDVRAFVGRHRCIFHLAGKNRAPEDEILRVNIEGVYNLAAAAEKHGHRHIIFASSNLIERRPDSAYAKSKLAGEKRLASLAGTGGCKVSLLRLANVYGPGCLPFYNSVVATFCWYAANEMCDQIPIHGDGTQKTDFVPVDTVIEALIACKGQQEDYSRQDVKGKVFSVKELADVICDSGKRSKYPALQAEYEFFANTTLPEQKPVRQYPLHSSASGSFQELLHDDEAAFGQLSICTIAPFDVRGGTTTCIRRNGFA